MITTADLIEKFKYALDNHWGYIANGAGQLWTEAKQKAATDEMTKEYGSKWIGHHVADCSGLFSWAFNQLGGYMYHGSNTMYRKYCTKVGEINGATLEPGVAVFKRKADKTRSDGWDYYHVGLYIGNGEVIEAQGTRTGVVKTKLNTWHFYGYLKGVAYGDQPVQTAPTIQNGVITTVTKGMAIVDVPDDTSVNVRSKPTKSSKVLMKINEGATVDVVENDGTWAKVEIKSYGYIMSRYLVEPKK